MYEEILTRMSQEEKYIITRWLYSISLEPLMSDEEYNLLRKYIQSVGSLPDYSERSWSSDPCPIDLLKKYKLEHLVATVVVSDKTESLYSITSEAELKNVYGNLDELAIVSYKHDGWNFQNTYFNGKSVWLQTRGRSTDAMDVSVLQEFLPKEISREGKARVIMEANISHVNFEKLKQMFPKKELVSQRMAVSTAIANPEARQLLSFTAFDILLEDGKELSFAYILYLLNQWGFTTPIYKTVTNYSELVQAMKDLSDNKEFYPYLTDGLVVRTNDSNSANAVRIYNWQENIYRSYVTGYTESRGSHDIAMKVTIYHIRLPNSTQRQVAVTNLARLQYLNLVPGAPIAFKLTSSAIAVLNEEATIMLHQMYKNKWEDYRYYIEYDEMTKQSNRLIHSQGLIKEIDVDQSYEEEYT